MYTRNIFGLCLLLAASTVQAANSDLSPSKVFELASPSIVVVEAHDKSGAVIELGSGVAIANGVVVSNCHVFTKADTATVHNRQQNLPAALLYGDTEHDLCSFTVNGLTAPPVKLGSTSQLKVGDQAFAIGAPEGLELTLSDGLVSSLRNIPGGVVLQVTTPISPGSSGGGLFDSQARLIGITSYYMKQGQQLNFALPVEWINELPLRQKLANPTSTASASNSKSTTTSTPESKPQSKEYVALSSTAAAAALQHLADQGSAMAQHLLGLDYESGQGVPQDYAQALMWFRKAAAQGYAESQDNLGAMYLRGEGVSQDYPQALMWFRKAAAQGNAYAQSNLGSMYLNGEGVPQDDNQAAMWFREAASQSNASGLNGLGVIYQFGFGVPQNSVVAYALYNLSASLDSSKENKATDSRSNLVNSMSQAQVEAGQSLSRQMQNVGVLKALDAYRAGFK